MYMPMHTGNQLVDGLVRVDLYVWKCFHPYLASFQARLSSDIIPLCCVLNFVRTSVTIILRFWKNWYGFSCSIILNTVSKYKHAYTLLIHTVYFVTFLNITTLSSGEDSLSSLFYFPLSSPFAFLQPRSKIFCSYSLNTTKICKYKYCWIEWW